MVPFRTTLSDLAKYTVTQSVAQSLCDSWASCFSGSSLTLDIISAKVHLL